MKLLLTNHMTGAELVLEGNDTQLDAQLRLRFPGVMAHVPHGNIAAGLYEISRLQNYVLQVVDGAIPRTVAPSNAIQYDQPEPVLQPEVPLFEKSLNEWLENDSLAKMAIKDLQPGELTSESQFENGSGSVNREHHDYSHLLPQHHRDNGYSIRLETDTSTGDYPRKYIKSELLRTTSRSNGGPLWAKVGEVVGLMYPTDPHHLDVTFSELSGNEHKGKGLGKSMYEALYAHAYHVHGAKTVGGTTHSTLAHRVHSGLAAKHGLDYRAEKEPRQNPDNPGSLEFDNAFGQYRYAMKSETESKRNLQNEIAINKDLVQDMLGFNPSAHSAFDTARLMSGGPLLSLNQLRCALYEEDGDIERASLRAYGMEPDEKSIKILRDLAYVARLGKSMDESAQKVVTPGTPEADDAAAAISRAFKEHSAQQVSINGKYSKGAMVAKDPNGGKIYLLKPSFDGNSSAAGVKEEKASQPRREAAFSHIGHSFGLGQDFVRADLIYVDGAEWAALELLPFNYKSLDARWKLDRSKVHKLLERYRMRGTLHKWAILDFVLGNPDRHGQNMMIGTDDDHSENETIKLIDHGSAFAGPDFDPSYDRNSFVPFYLRYLAPDKFNSLSVKDKLRVMPKLTEGAENDLRAWFETLSADKLRTQMEHFIIDPGPSLSRLAKLHIIPGPLCEAINRAWVGT